MVASWTLLISSGCVAVRFRPRPSGDRASAILFIHFLGAQAGCLRERGAMMKIVWVDLPVIDRSDKNEPKGQFLNAAKFTGPKAKQQAVDWLKALFGNEAVNEDGQISVLSEGKDD